jgi:hypothetical protein
MLCRIFQFSGKTVEYRTAIKKKKRGGGGREEKGEGEEIRIFKISKLPLEPRVPPVNAVQF